MQIKQRVSLKNIVTLLGIVFILTFSVIFVLIQAETTVPAFKARMAKKARSAILIREAKGLGLTYESVVAAPTKAMGKPAVWCLKRRSSQEVFYKSNGWERIYIKNPREMYDISGSRHQSCIDTLVTIRSITASEISGARNIRLEVDFVDYP